jgi:hypothetical protein
MPVDLRVTGPCDFGKLEIRTQLALSRFEWRIWNTATELFPQATQMLFRSICDSRSEVQMSLEM